MKLFKSCTITRIILASCMCVALASSRSFSTGRFWPLRCGHGLITDSSIPECAVSAMHKYELDQFRLSINMIVAGHIWYMSDLGESKLKTYSRKRRIVLRTYKWTNGVRVTECQKLEISSRQRW